MRKTWIGALAPALLLLAACGGKGDDKLADQAHDALENKADAMDAAADNMTGPAADMMEANAQATHDAADAKEEAIDDSDVNADALTAGEKSAVINGN
jgi:hypothetical protein